MLPFSWSGRVALPPTAGQDPESVIGRIATALGELRARAVQREPGAVVFEGGLFRFALSWNLLGPIGWGRVEAAPGAGGLEVHYRINFVEVVTAATVLVGFMAFVILSSTGPDAGPVRYVIPVVMWLWFVGGNIAITLVRFPAFIRRVGASA